MIKVLQKLGSAWGFLGITALIYVVSALFNPALVMESLVFFVQMFIGVIPVLITVFALMFLTNMFLKAEKITAYIGKGSGIKGWLMAIGGGILSAGPIYMWYPLLSDLKEKGMRDSLIAAFIYNRAVKIPFIPVMVFYFGMEFTIILSLLMIGFSVGNGILVERIVRRR